MISRNASIMIIAKCPDGYCKMSTPYFEYLEIEIVREIKCTHVCRGLTDLTI